MREILFRGKSKDNGNWIEGYYVCDESGQEMEQAAAYIYHLNQHPCGWSLIRYEVYPESVSEFTGLTDKNGTKIFEGDIVSISGELQEIYTCVWEEYNFGYEFANKTMSFSLACVGSDDIEIIGNIHDNSELLKGGEE